MSHIDIIFAVTIIVLILGVYLSFYVENKEDDCHQCDDYFNEKWNSHNNRKD